MSKISYIYIVCLCAYSFYFMCLSSKANKPFSDFIIEFKSHSFEFCEVVAVAEAVVIRIRRVAIAAASRYGRIS